MVDKIGPTFTSDLRAAGVPLDGLAWRADTGEILCSDADHAAAAEAVLAKHDPTKVPPELVPDSASRLGLMRALREINKWDAAKAAIASNTDAQEEWDLAISIKRDDPLTAGIIQALGLTSADVDQLLIRAAALTS